MDVKPVLEDAVESLRAAWRITARVERTEKSEGNELETALLRGYAAKVKAGLQRIYHGTLTLV